MSSRSIISSSLGCKCSFDHSLHFVSIYQSQDSVNLKQQHSKSKENWAPKALTASWRGGVWCCLFSKLFTSKNFRSAVGYSSERQEEIFTLSRQHCKSETQSSCWLLEAHRCSSRSETGTGEGVLRWQNLFYVKVCVRLLGLIHSVLKSLKPIGLTHKVLWSRSFAGFNSLCTLVAAYMAFRTKQKHHFLIPSLGAKRRTALQMLSLATTSKNSLAPSS